MVQVSEEPVLHGHNKVQPCRKKYCSYAAVKALCDASHV